MSRRSCQFPRVRTETKGRIALVAACLVALVALFTRLELSPEPPTKGFCGFVGPCVSCADVSR